MKTAMSDPYQVVMRKTELPISLLTERGKFARVHLLETESFASTFGKNSSRKKANMAVGSIEEMVAKAESANGSYLEEKDKDR
jgi:nuclear GTP-binding protein